MKVRNIMALTPTPILCRLPTKRLSRDSLRLAMEIAATTIHSAAASAKE